VDTMPVVSPAVTNPILTTISDSNTDTVTKIYSSKIGGTVVASSFYEPVAEDPIVTAPESNFADIQQQHKRMHDYLSVMSALTPPLSEAEIVSKEKEAELTSIISEMLFEKFRIEHYPFIRDISETKKDLFKMRKEFYRAEPGTHKFDVCKDNIAVYSANIKASQEQFNAVRKEFMDSMEVHVINEKKKMKDLLESEVGSIYGD